MTRRAGALITAIFFSWASMTAAWAKDGRLVRLALVDVDGNTSPDSTDIHYFVEKGIRLSGAKVQLMPLDGVLNAGEQATDIQNVAFGQEAFENGLKKFEAGDCEGTLDQLGQAITYFEQSFAFLDDPDQYIEALLHQAVCLQRAGMGDAALTLAVKALVVQPKAKTARFGKAKALFDRAQKTVFDSQLSSLAVSSTPEGSRVFVNGRYRGVSPAFRPGLRRGVHFVRVERQGFARQGLRVDTRTGEAERKVEVTLSPARKKAYLESLLPGLQREIGLPEPGATTKQLQGALLVDYVILYRASGPAANMSVELALYDLAAGRLLKRVAGKTNWEERSKAAKNRVIGLAKDLLQVEFETRVSITDPTPAPGGDGGSGGGVATKWWFWTVIGVAVLGGVTAGLVVGLQPDEAPAGIDSDGTGALLLRF